MKYIFLFLCLYSLNLYGQSAHIREIKDNPGDQFYHTGDSTIVYPLIVTKNPAADKLMNEARVQAAIAGGQRRQMSW